MQFKIKAGWTRWSASSPAAQNLNCNKARKKNTLNKYLCVKIRQATRAKPALPTPGTLDKKSIQITVNKHDVVKVRYNVQNRN